jgi:hypothetical protein
LAEKYGLENAMEFLAGDSSFMFETTSILDDQDLKDAGIYKEYNKSNPDNLDNSKK